jgi:hypothetical protein
MRPVERAIDGVEGRPVLGYKVLSDLAQRVGLIAGMVWAPSSGLMVTVFAMASNSTHGRLPFALMILVVVKPGFRAFTVTPVVHLDVSRILPYDEG